MTEAEFASLPPVFLKSSFILLKIFPASPTPPLISSPMLVSPPSKPPIDPDAD